MALVVLTGGARSGKSSVASHLAEQRRRLGQAVVYAVFGEPLGDPEFSARVDDHQMSRSGEIRTIEAFAHPESAFDSPDHALLVIDCLGTALGSVLYHELARASINLSTADQESLPEGVDTAVQTRFDAFVSSIVGRSGDTIVVTNEVGDGIIPLYASGRLFRDVLGRANRTLVDSSDAAYLCVAGRLVDLHSQPRNAQWPED